MKNVFFALVAMLFISTTSFATNDTNFDASIKITTVNPSEITEVNLSFNSSKDFEALDVNQLNIESFDICTASVTVTVSVGFGSTFVSASITLSDIPCDEIGAAVADARAQALAAIKS